MIDFTMKAGRLLMTNYRIPVARWAVPGGDDVIVINVSTDDMGGGAMCEVIELSDGRTVLVNYDDGFVAAIYPSLDAAYDGQPNDELVEA